jgi:hypothetical protein
MGLEPKKSDESIPHIPYKPFIPHSPHVRLDAASQRDRTRFVHFLLQMHD